MLKNHDLGTVAQRAAQTDSPQLRLPDHRVIFVCWSSGLGIDSNWELTWITPYKSN